MTARKAFVLILILEGAVGLLAIFNDGLTVEGLQAVARFSGRLSLFLFSIIFLFRNSKSFNIETILSGKYFAVFAMAHGIHLIELLSFVYLSGAELIPYRVAGGFIAYVLIFAMPWIENSYRKGNITAARFGLLANLYLYYVLFIFFMTYLSRVTGKVPGAGGSYTEHVVLLVFVLLTFWIKVAVTIFLASTSKKTAKEKISP